MKKNIQSDCKITNILLNYLLFMFLFLRYEKNVVNLQ